METAEFSSRERGGSSLVAGGSAVAQQGGGTTTGGTREGGWTTEEQRVVRGKRELQREDREWMRGEGEAHDLVAGGWK
ncbi:hypothetical protein AMTR_s00028p00150660 [Amborella trichopoda]|uniref:Uncharacterized protein n=1 Tax=Amborella trichopoda TaxID=13333 RepID=W1PRD2_AMBTC|nr:hypothetical protein AMTR_s00028p00150660 [Amborella trichopoda]